MTMNVPVTLNAMELLKLLRQQRACYRRLAALTQRQQVLVTDDDPQALLGLLSQRQQVVDALTALNQRLAPYRQAWTRVYETLDTATKKEVKAMLEESNAILASVMSADRQDAEALSARRESVSSALSAARRAGEATAAYASCEATTAQPPSWTEARA